MNASSSDSQDFRKSQIKSLTELNDVEQAFREFRVMLRYALAEGLALDENTRQAVAAVEQLAPKFPASAGAAAAAAPDDAREQADVFLIMTAHGSLAKVVAPATPRSLEATEPGPGLLGSFRRPPLILAMILIALFAAIGFVITSVIFQAPTKSGSNDGTKTVSMALVPAVLGGRLQQSSVVLAADPQKVSLGAPPDAPTWQKQLNWCFAAALGAVFYVLFTVHEYVKNRTFDPQYNSLYLIRFVLGIIAGLILANVMAAPALSKNETVGSLGPVVIALLGGFSTEAVYQILQRLVDVMVAAVRGDNSDAAKAKAAQSAQKELLSLAGDPTVTPALLSKIHAAVEKMAQ